MRITPAIAVRDEHAAYWVARVILMLRREMCWCWRMRDSQHECPAALPPFGNSAAEYLDLIRYENDKVRYFESDPTAQYLSEQLETLCRPQAVAIPERGSWLWVSETLVLDEVAQFVLALALAARIDAGIGPVLAACMNDRSRPFPTLALAQRIWPDPLTVTTCADRAHPLFRSGLLRWGDLSGDMNWLMPLDLHPAVALQLVNPGGALPHGLRPLPQDATRSLDPGASVLADRLGSQAVHALEAVPLIGPPGADYEAWAASLANGAGRSVAVIDPAIAAEPGALQATAVVAWLRNYDVLLPEWWTERVGERNLSQFFSSVENVATRWYLPAPSREALAFVPTSALTPALCVLPLTFEERVARYRALLGPSGNGLDAAIEECSRRFRFQDVSIERVVKTLFHGGTPPDLASLLAVCRTEAAISMGTLAQAVIPRFTPAQLVLPVRQKQQFDEILIAMSALTEVHYRWGTARVWNESGLAVLFSGSPGTGKTMAAEALANALGLPMYRIDLSQVVNKYIGETEKNLRRIFDAAELSDCILFFDEADALFGKRTEVKSGNDRFANIEISYLLERMERFKGLAILATNRRRDMDEAFCRRVRYIVEFPQPGPEEREQIWCQVFPPDVDVTAIEFDFLARQFPLSGAHIRSIAFAACLQLAGTSRGRSMRRMDMETVLRAVKRELEKLNRAAGEEIFGQRYGALWELAK
jgi:vesicle-fusing ATPase